MRRRDFIATAASGTAMLCSPNVVSAQPNRVLRYRPNNDLTVLDPIFTSVFVTRFHANAAFDTLYGQDNDLNPHPQMVEGHQVENDGRLWRLTLREGLRFHDGEPVRGRDCVASIRRWGRVDAFGQALLAVTDELSAPSDKEIVFRLRRPFPLLPNALGKSSTFVPVIMPERQASADLTRPIPDPVGSGPYRFVHGERMAGQLVVYEKFKDYVPRPGGRSEYTSGAKVPYFERIEWRIMPDHATAAAALQMGEIDWHEDPLSDLLPVLRRNPRIVVENISTLGNMGMIRFNHLQPPFDDPRIRQIVAKALSQTELMEGVAGDTWSDKVGFFCPESPMASSEGIPPAPSKPDYVAIKGELAQAGYKGEQIVLIDAPSSPGIHMQAEVAADQLRRAGMNVDLVALDFGNWLQRRNSREVPNKGGWNILTTFLPGQELWDPVGHLGIRGNKLNAWSGWPDSPKIEGLRDAWLTAATDAERKAICRDIQLQAWQDLPYVPSGRWTVPTAYRKGLTGISRHIPIFYNLKEA